MREKVALFQVFVLFTMAISLLVGCGDAKVNMKQNDKRETDLKAGGCCTYNSFSGHARITRIMKTEASVGQKGIIGGAGYEGYEVWFRFIPEQKLPSGFDSSGFLGREHLYTLQNGWYVGPRYLEKYKIRTGKEYPCVLKIIEKGSCSPLVFDFTTMGRGDYFEIQP